MCEPLPTIASPADVEAERHWYALQVTSRFESAVVRRLERYDIESYLPMTLTLQRTFGKGETRKVAKPLFPGYLFSRFSLEDRYRVKDTPDVHDILGGSRQPTPIAPADLDAIRAMLRSDRPVQTSNELPVGKRVRVIDGALIDQVGLLVRIKSSDRFLVSLPLLGRSVSVEIDRGCVEAA